MKNETWLPGEIYKNRKLVFSLAKNDFKTKYAGSYFGTIWAFIQPIVTICVYWFVFGLALRNGSDKGVPFVLWLIAGLIPWFFFQEGLVWRNECTSRIQLSGQKSCIQHPDPSGCESIFSGFCTCIFYHYRTADLYFYGISTESVCDTASVL